MMQISARSYTNASEMMANSKAIRDRPMSVPSIRTMPKKTPRMVPFEKLIWNVPSWMVQPTQFDSHVRVYNFAKCQRGMSIRNYIKTRCMELGVVYEDVVGKTRRGKPTHARQLIMWEIKTEINPDIHYTVLGKMFGGRDHTTSMHAVHKIQAMKDAGAI